MVRKLVLFIAFLAMLGQVVAGASLPLRAGASMEHALAHVQDDGHHHHDDGGMHVDEAEEGTFHAHADSANSAVPPGRVSLLLPAGVPPPPVMQASALPAPPIDDLLRPPTAS